MRARSVVVPPMHDSYSHYSLVLDLSGTYVRPHTPPFTRHPSHAILHTSPQENSSELVELVAEGLEHAQSEVGGACLNQRMAVRSLCDGVSNLVAQEFDRELEQHQVSSYTKYTVTDE